MTRRTPLTVNVNMDRIPGGMPGLLNLLTRWTPQSVLCMNAFVNEPDNRVIQTRNFMESIGGKTIYRPYRPDENALHNNLTPQQYIDFLISIGAPGSRIHFQIGNEPVTNDETSARRLSTWYRDVIYLAHDRDIWTVTPNWPTGAIQRYVIDSHGQTRLATIPGIDKRVVTSGWLDEWMLALIALRNERVNGFCKHGAGFHTYAHGDEVTAEGLGYAYLQDFDFLADPARWPSKDDVQVNIDDNWFVGRSLWFAKRMKELAPGMTDDDMVDIDLDEFGLDDLGGDVVQNAPQVYTWLNDNWADDPAGQNDKKARGYPTLRRYKEEVGRRAGRDMAWAICKKWRWACAVLPKYVRTLALFTYSDFSEPPNYWGDRYGIQHIQEAIDYWPVEKAELEAQWAQGDGGTVDFPDDPGPGTHIRLEQAEASLRAQPRIDGTRIDILNAGEVATLYLETALVGGNYTWCVIRFGSALGWGAISGAGGYALDYTVLVAETGITLTTGQLYLLNSKLEETETYANEARKSAARTQKWLEVITAPATLAPQARSAGRADYTLTVSGGAGLNVRAAPMGAIVGALQTGARVTLTDAAPQNAGGYTWRNINQPVSGWIATDAGGVSLIPAANGGYIEIPPPEMAVNDTATAAAMVEWLHWLADAISSFQ